MVNETIFTRISNCNQTLTTIGSAIITCFIVIPVKISFCYIIFSDDEYQQYIPSLLKLVALTSVVHQIVTTIYNDMPYAVGQMQDAGIIYLAAIATSISDNTNKKSVLSTTLIMLSFGTICCGLAILIINKFNFSGYVHYVPRPVISGYFAYIGLYLGISALSLMSGTQIKNISDLWIPEIEHVSICAIGLLVGCILFFSMIHWKDVRVVAFICIFSLSSFYLLLIVYNISFVEARRVGWIDEYNKSVPFYHCWTLISFKNFDVNAAKLQIYDILNLVVVVTMSSVLDVKAVHMSSSEAFDVSAEYVYYHY